MKLKYAIHLESNAIGFVRVLGLAILLTTAENWGDARAYASFNFQDINSVPPCLN